MSIKHFLQYLTHLADGLNSPEKSSYFYFPSSINLKEYPLFFPRPPRKIPLICFPSLNKAMSLHTNNYCLQYCFIKTAQYSLFSVDLILTAEFASSAYHFLFSKLRSYLEDFSSNLHQRNEKSHLFTTPILYF